MSKERKGFDKSQQGQRVDNLPKTGHLTGSFKIDLYGCWWEVVEDETCKPFWIIGEYPTTQSKTPKRKRSKGNMAGREKLKKPKEEEEKRILSVFSAGEG